jgi:hypothetical protein
MPLLRLWALVACSRVNFVFFPLPAFVRFIVQLAVDRSACGTRGKVGKAYRLTTFWSKNLWHLHVDRVQMSPSVYCVGRGRSVWGLLDILDASVFRWNLYYLLTAWSRVLLEKLIGSQLVRKFPVFYETGMFITAFTSARLSQIDPVHAPHPTSRRFINIILPSTPSYSNWSLSRRSPHQNPVYASPPRVLHASPISFSV